MNKITIQSEMQRRTDLIESMEFRKQCAVIAQKIGITEEEWEKNKVIFMMFVANEYCSLENKN